MTDDDAHALVEYVRDIRDAQLRASRWSHIATGSVAVLAGVSILAAVGAGLRALNGRTQFHGARLAWRGRFIRVRR